MPHAPPHPPQIVYYFGEPTRQLYGDVFSLNATSGEVVVSGRVDYELSPVYRLMLSARDRGPDPVSADAMLVVRVLDANDNAPEISVNTLAEADAEGAEVSEGAGEGTFVAYVSAKDADSGVNGRVNCSLKDQTHFRLKARAKSSILFDERFDVENNKIIVF